MQAKIDCYFLNRIQAFRIVNILLIDARICDIFYGNRIADKNQINNPRFESRVKEGFFSSHYQLNLIGFIWKIKIRGRCATSSIFYV